MTGSGSLSPEQDEDLPVAGTLDRPVHRVLSQHVVQALRAAILAGRFPPGSVLVEQRLADEFDTSRQPVREALRILAREGLVVLVPHRRAAVRTVSRDLAADVFAIRRLLETEAARSAVDRVTPADLRRLHGLIDDMTRMGAEGQLASLVETDVMFHRQLVALSGRPVLEQIMQPVWGLSALLISVTRRYTPLDKIGAIHEPILAVLERRDAEALARAIEEHTQLGMDVLDSSEELVEAEPVSDRRPRVLG